MKTLVTLEGTLNRSAKSLIRRLDGKQQFTFSETSTLKNSCLAVKVGYIFRGNMPKFPSSLYCIMFD